VASSPIVTDDAVILFQDREDGESPDRGWLVAVDKRSGEELWRDEWDDTCCSYTTPVLVERGGRRILLATTSQQANAYDPVTGSRLWQVPHRNTQPVPSAAVWDEYVTFPGAIHDALLSTFRLGPPEAAPEPLWASRQAVPDIPSPVYFGGRLYALTTGGVMTSLNPETGKAVRRLRLPSRDYRAALVAGDGKIYAVNDDGNTAVLKVDEKRFKLLRENKLDEGSGATPAIAGGCLLIRGADHLFCLEKKGSGDDAEA
jgi:outer membrane protein assembly factor BamB